MSIGSGVSTLEVDARVSGQPIRAQPEKSPNLDLLRSAAVISVFAAHLSMDVLHLQKVGPFWMKSLGQTGVILFFVHTTLVLLQSLDRSSRAGRFRNFYIRRTFRIYPLTILTVLTVVLLRIPSLPELPYEWVGWKNLVSNLFLTTNLTGGAVVSGPLWSLPFEIQMYAVLPLLYVLSLREKEQRWSLWAISLIAVMAALMTGHDSLYNLARFVPCFVAGSFGFRQSEQPRWRSWSFPIFVLALIGSLSLVPVQSLWSMPTAWGACAMLGALIPSFRENSCAWINGASKRVAELSFSIYLCHMPLMYLLLVKLHAGLAVRWASFAVSMIAAPLFLFNVVENPMIQVGRRFTIRDLPTGRIPRRMAK